MIYIDRRQVVVECVRGRSHWSHFHLNFQVLTSQAVIDNRPPHTYMHIHLKLKKLQVEEERLAVVERDNRILLEKMSWIMRTKKGFQHPTYIKRRCVQCRKPYKRDKSTIGIIISINRSTNVPDSENFCASPTKIRQTIRNILNYYVMVQIIT